MKTILFLIETIYVPLYDSDTTLFSIEHHLEREVRTQCSHISSTSYCICCNFL
jgi:hypothetical protein